MLHSNTITSIGIFGGSLLTLLIWIGAVVRMRKLVWSGVPFMGVWANSMTFSTIGCFVYNLCYFILTRTDSIDVLKKNALDIEGNETTVLVSFGYALYMVAAGTIRSVAVVCNENTPTNSNS